MKSRIAAIVMSALLVLYLALVVQLAVRLIGVDSPVGKFLGIALIVLPLLGFWAMLAELLFGIRSQRLVAMLKAHNQLPVEVLPMRSSGRPIRSAADAEFPLVKADVEANPGRWQAWFRLGLSYDACGDRRRARSSIRRAIDLERQSR